MKNKEKIICALTAAAISMSAISSSASADWVKFSDGAYGYRDSMNKQLTGLQTIGGGKYYFDKNGKAVTGLKKIGENTYYFDPAKKGKAVVSAWLRIGSKRYYFGADGIMKTGWVSIGGDTYHLGADGVMSTGKVNISGKIYDLGSDGVFSLYHMCGLEPGMSMEDVIKAKRLSSGDYSIKEGSLRFQVGKSPNKYSSREKNTVIVNDGKYTYYYSFDKSDRLSMMITVTDYIPETADKFAHYVQDNGLHIAYEKRSEYEYQYFFENDDRTVSADILYDAEEVALIMYY